MKKTYKVILLIESSRASGRNYLQGIARYAHHHGPWSFYWEPGGFESDAADFEDAGRGRHHFSRCWPAEGAGAPARHSGGGGGTRQQGGARHYQRGDGFIHDWADGGGTFAGTRVQALCFLRAGQHVAGTDAVVETPV